MKLPNVNEQSTANLKNPVWFREWFKIIMRQWSNELTMQQLAVVLFIFDRTAAWGKEWEYIRYTSFTTGVTNKDGSVRYAGGICNSVSTATRITKELVESGHLLKKRSKLGNKWSLNYDFHTKDKPMNTRKTRSDHSRMNGCNLSPMNGSIITSKEKGNVSQNNRRGEASATGNALEDALIRARGKAQAARERQEQRKKGKLNSIDVSRVWTTAVQKSEWSSRDDIASGRVFLSKKESQALKSYSDRFHKNYPSKPFREFLTWVIVEWQNIRTELFAWMTKAPAPNTPAALFIIKWAEKLEQRYMQDIAFEHKLTSSNTTRMVKSKPTTNSVESKPFKDVKRRRTVRISKTSSLPTMDNEAFANEYED